MPWDQTPPTQALVGREAIAPRPVAPLAGFGDTGPGAGVGADTSAAQSDQSSPSFGASFNRAGLHELMRSAAISGTIGPSGIPPDAVTLVVYHPTTNPWFVTFDGRVPILPTLAAGRARSHDLAIPGNSITVFPIPSDGRQLTALMDNSAPSALDSGYETVFYVTSDRMPPSTSRLS